MLAFGKKYGRKRTKTVSALTQLTGQEGLVV